MVIIVPGLNNKPHNPNAKWGPKRGLPMRPELNYGLEQPSHVHNWIESMTRQHSKQAYKQSTSSKMDAATDALQSENSSNQKSERRRRRSKSEERLSNNAQRRNDTKDRMKDNSNNSTPEKSKKKQYALAMKERHMHGTPLKSVSLTELTEIDRARRKGSCSSLRSQWLPKSLASQIHPLDQHGPSSTSSTGTVVQIMKDQDNGYNSALLEEIRSGSSSLPPELQYIIVQATNTYVKSKHANTSKASKESPEESKGLRETSKTSQTSLSSSKQSGSHSYETVIEVDTNKQRHNISAKHLHTIPNPDYYQSQIGQTKRPLLDNLINPPDSMDTEEEIELVKQSENITRKGAEGKDSDGSSSPSNPLNQIVARRVMSRSNEVPVASSRAQSLPKETLTPNDEFNAARNISTQTPKKNTKTSYLSREQHNVQQKMRKQPTSRKFRGSGTTAQHGEFPMYQPSSTATTSEDERLMGMSKKDRNESHANRREHMVEGAGGGRVRRTSYPANSSTWESGAPIDRAKSFEYFPGESFPMQENSSSYEYLPGHMVSDRPGTVVSNHPQDKSGNEEGRETLDGKGHRGPVIAETSSQLSNGDYSTTSSLQSSSNVEIEQTEPNSAYFEEPKNQSNQNSKKRGYVGVYEMATQTHSLALDLNSISNEMMQKYKHLQNTQLSQTRSFYKKMKKYIEFISTPSKTPNDCVLKQKLADKILEVMTNEEYKLSGSRSLSSQFGNLFVSKEAARRHPGRAASSTNPSPKFTATQVAHASFTPADTKAPELGYSDEDEPRNCQGGDEMDHPERFQFEPSSSKADPSLNNSLANPNQRLSPKDDNQNHRIASPHYFPSLQNWIGPSKVENISDSKDIEIQKLRIEQMKKLRKEIRKLEKLECVRLNRAMGGNDENDAELLRQVRDNQSSFDSLVTESFDENTTEVMTSKREKKLTQGKYYAVAELSLFVVGKILKQQ